MPTPNVMLFPLRTDSHRVTRAPRFHRDGGALWLGLGLCLMTLLVLHRTDRR